MIKYLLTSTLPLKTATTLGLLLVANLLSGSTKTINCHKLFSTEDTTVYEKADREPRFTGDRSWISKRTMYPSDLTGKDLKGNVTVSFIIEKDGSVSNVTFIESFYPKLDSLLFNAVKNYPKWEPAMINGKPVRFKKIQGVRYAGKPDGVYLPRDPIIAESFMRYLQRLNKEKEAMASKKEIPAEEQLKKINSLKEQLGDDATVREMMLANIKETKANLDSIVKAQTILLKLDAQGTNQLREIYNQELDGKLRLIENLGQEQFITQFVAAELQFRQLELDKILAIKKLLDDEFRRYFEYVVLKE
ncbi:MULTISPECIES: energy transducer TonB [unclassified Butyricimonas]|uniref:energy transducer TonB n=1 Tax=unclassified Butyricimonas TaxID=2637652 RepID=UPI000C08D36F|nr:MULTISPECIES: energy transducer TonB [unclassified Butyricimonas]